MNRCFTKDIDMSNKHMKKKFNIFSYQGNANLNHNKYYNTHIRMAKLQSTVDSWTTQGLGAPTILKSTCKNLKSALKICMWLWVEPGRSCVCGFKQLQVTQYCDTYSWKKFTYKWILAVQTLVVQWWTVLTVPSVGKIIEQLELHACFQGYKKYSYFGKLAVS